MILRLFNDDLDVEFSVEEPTVLFVEDYKSYVSIIRSIEEETYLNARMPYLFLDDDGKKITKKGAVYLQQDCLHFPKLGTPVKNKLFNVLRVRLREEFKDSEIERHAISIYEEILDASLDLWGDYNFEKDWDILTFLKGFKLEPDIGDEYSVLENQIAWLEFLSDIDMKLPVIYANLAKNIDQNDLKILLNQANFLQIPVLLIESGNSFSYLDNLNSYTIDLDFCTFKNPVR